jgi:hypothetical protein
MADGYYQSSKPNLGTAQVVALSVRFRSSERMEVSRHRLDLANFEAFKPNEGLLKTPHPLSVFPERALLKPIRIKLQSLSKRSAVREIYCLI